MNPGGAPSGSISQTPLPTQLAKMCNRFCRGHPVNLFPRFIVEPLDLPGDKLLVFGIVPDHIKLGLDDVTIFLFKPIKLDVTGSVWIDEDAAHKPGMLRVPLNDEDVPPIQAWTIQDFPSSVAGILCVLLADRPISILQVG